MQQISRLRDRIVKRGPSTPDNMVEIDGRRYLRCSQCKKPLTQGYDSPEATPPGEKYHPVLCGLDYRTAFARTYPESPVPDVPDGFLEQV